MSNSYKPFLPDDIGQTRSLIYESIAISGAIADYQSTYGTYPLNTSVKTFYHGMFQKVYDYIYTNSSANAVFDISLGVHSDSDARNTSVGTGDLYDRWTSGGNYDSTRNAYETKKAIIYNRMAQELVGYGYDGSILKFDKDGDFSGTTTDKYNEAFFLTFSRLLVKDEMKKGTFKMILGMNPYGYTQSAKSGFSTTPKDTYDWDGGGLDDSYVLISDYDGATSYKVNSPAGDYGILYGQNCNSDGTTIYASSDTGHPLEPSLLDSDNKVPVGLVFYQAGVVVLTPWLFLRYNSADGEGLINDGNLTTYENFYMLYDSTGNYATPVDPTDDYYDITEIVRGSEELSGATDDQNISIDDFGSALRQRIVSINFDNTIELNSTIYFCRAGRNDFNYSSNPTYTSNGKIVVKNTSQDLPVTYITTVGLYGPDNELLAVAKLSEPVKKTPENDITIKTRMDY